MPGATSKPSDTTTVTPVSLEPIRKSVLVAASQEHAFRVFTEGMDTWWPRSHHIGDSPMKKVVIEPHAGGRVYTEQQNGAVCQWGTVMAWEPPSRFLMSWQITPEWKFESDLARCSEVEVRFVPAPDGKTLVELEHRAFERHGGAYANMREMVNADGGWNSLLHLFAQTAAKGA